MQQWIYFRLFIFNHNSCSQSLFLYFLFSLFLYLFQCLLQCVYRKVKAVDSNNFPSAEGLVRLYSEGVQDRNYFTATYQAVQFCMKLAEQVRQSKPNGVLDGGQTCDLAYDMFNCVSDQIEKVSQI
ncbi:general odorant-binding protein 70 [Diaphorina citri]|uniref:General odorant-binding protein 70 n=1 Tax=Diaphorina citri TaxID=121845 RepID=A0A3Q0ITI2_DIACI|nr:general odorant-binding protein 70 [Diaphorina citri]